MTVLENFYLKQDEPTKGTLLALREIILCQDKDITNVWKYGMPFFCYKGKMFCYLWLHKKLKQILNTQEVKIMQIQQEEEIEFEQISIIGEGGDEL